MKNTKNPKEQRWKNNEKHRKTLKTNIKKQ